MNQIKYSISSGDVCAVPKDDAGNRRFYVLPHQKKAVDAIRTKGPMSTLDWWPKLTLADADAMRILLETKQAQQYRKTIRHAVIVMCAEAGRQYWLNRKSKV